MIVQQETSGPSFIGALEHLTSPMPQILVPTQSYLFILSTAPQSMDLLIFSPLQDLSCSSVILDLPKSNHGTHISTTCIWRGFLPMLNQPRGVDHRGPPILFTTVQSFSLLRRLARNDDQFSNINVYQITVSSSLPQFGNQSPPLSLVELLNPICFLKDLVAERTQRLHHQIVITVATRQVVLLNASCCAHKGS